MKIFRNLVSGLLAVVVLALAVLYGIATGWFGSDEVAGEVAGPALPAIATAARAERQRAVAGPELATRDKQILFGDFHVHTTFSFDAFLMNMPLAGGTGSHPPAEACDFARYCSQLDFWSINDHAENLTRRMWDETVESVRQCNAVAGDPADPDLVTFLGWEWSHIGPTPDTHYGHKNVVLLGTDDEQIPARPISSLDPERGAGTIGAGLRQRALLGVFGGARGRDFARFLTQAASVEACPLGVPVRELPPDCHESAPTPEQLFEKLDDWGHPAVVIPHGTAWGLYTPAGSDWRKQLPGHDPERQTLVEVYSGHGNSEEYRDWRAVKIAADGTLSCPEPQPNYLPSCWHSGEIIRAACLEAGESEAECETRAATARQHYVDAYQGGWKTIGGYPAEAWLDAGQCRDCFQPSFNYRPLGSVQYMLALRDFSNAARPKRFEFGFISSSDNHTANPGTGYKEFARGFMSEGRAAAPGGGGGGGIFGSSAGPPRAASQPRDMDAPVSPLALFETERASAYFLTGGLVAVHAEARHRDAIWGAMQRKEVYATSGPRILLWFDLLDEAGGAPRPMGSKVRRASAPRFRARAAGSFEQKPGCPDFVREGLGAERTREICLDECYHPSDRRRAITHIEVVRIRPQTRADEPIEGLVDDPWRRFPCPPSPEGCVVEFADPEFAGAARDAVYYVRALEEPTQAIHGSNPLGCVYDEQGRCQSVDPCDVNTPAPDDCLSPTQQRAWSSPIFVDYAAR